MFISHGSGGWTLRPRCWLGCFLFHCLPSLKTVPLCCVPHCRQHTAHGTSECTWRWGVTIQQVMWGVTPVLVPVQSLREMEAGQRPAQAGAGGGPAWTRTFCTQQGLVLAGRKGSLSFLPHHGRWSRTAETGPVVAFGEGAGGQGGREPPLYLGSLAPARFFVYEK